MARRSPGGVTTGCARCWRPSRRRCRSRSPRRRGRRRRAARRTAARRGSARSRPAAKATAWCAPRRLRSPQHSRGRWSSWSRSRRPRGTGLDLAVPAVAVLKQPSVAAARAAPTARGATRCLRAPCRTPRLAERFVLTTEREYPPRLTERTRIGAILGRQGRRRAGAYPSTPAHSPRPTVPARQPVRGRFSVPVRHVHILRFCVCSGRTASPWRAADIKGSLPSKYRLLCLYSIP